MFKGGNKRIKKGRSMDWMKMVIKVFEEVGEGEIIDLIEEGKENKRSSER